MERIWRFNVTKYYKIQYIESPTGRDFAISRQLTVAWGRLFEK